MHQTIKKENAKNASNNKKKRMRKTHQTIKKSENGIKKYYIPSKLISTIF